MTAIITAPNDQIAKRNLMVLISIQATIGAMIPMHFTLAGPTGGQLTSHVALATMPVTATIVGGMVASPIIARLSIRMGRPPAFAIATFLAAFGLTLAGFAIHSGSFLLYALGSFLLGFYMSAQGMFRFAANDMASPAFRPRAISFALIGGLFAAVISRYVVKNYSIPDAALPYFILAVLTFFIGGAYFLLRLPMPKDSGPYKRVPLGPILRQRKVIASMVISITAYSIMNLMMTSTPLAVEGCGFTRGDSASIVSAHVVAMFAPSFFTGYLISWFGLRRIVFAGMLILGTASLVALGGISLTNFYLALIVLGIGWNFAFVGGTAMLTSAVTDPDAAKTLQGFNDTVLWSCVAVVSLLSGVMMNYFGDGGAQGWHLVNYAVLPILIVALIVGWWFTRPEKS